MRISSEAGRGAFRRFRRFRAAMPRVALWRVSRAGVAMRAWFGAAMKRRLAPLGRASSRLRRAPCAKSALDACSRTSGDKVRPATAARAGTASLLQLAVMRPQGSPWTMCSDQAGRLIVHPAASRIFAESPEHLLAAQASLLAPVWSPGPRPLGSPVGERCGVEKCLDLFFLEACLQREAELPWLARIRFRLAHWPDLGGEEPRYPWVLGLAGTIARQAPVTVSGVAQLSVERLSIGPASAQHCRINALFWALWASGALQRAESRSSQKGHINQTIK